MDNEASLSTSSCTWTLTVPSIERVNTGTDAESQLEEDIFTQTLKISGIPGDGIFFLTVNAEATIDLAENKSEEVQTEEAIKTVVIDNTLPSIEINNPEITNTLNNTHANKTHTITYVITASDTNLLSANTIVASDNALTISLINTEIVLKLNGTVLTCEYKNNEEELSDASCTWALTDPTIIRANVGVNTDSQETIDEYTQTLKIELILPPIPLVAK